MLSSKKNKAVFAALSWHPQGARRNASAAAFRKTDRSCQFHWGGGTPTYLTPAQIEDLFNFTREHFPILAGC